MLQVLSGDESGTICMWNIHTGERQGHFKRCHGNGRLTAMTLDAQERRLLTGSNSGELKMWNFNSGSQLREFAHREEHVEYSALRFVHDADRQSSLVRLKTNSYILTDTLAFAGLCGNACPPIVAHLVMWLFISHQHALSNHKQWYDCQADADACIL